VDTSLDPPQIHPGERTLDGHMELDDRPEVQGASAPRPFGANQAKVCTGDLARRMSLWARMGHACGLTFELAPFLKTHPEYSWELPLFRNVDSHPWTLFSSR
jgi:hypothetical protein